MPVEDVSRRSEDGSVLMESGLSTEGQDLLVALKRFTVSLLRSTDSHLEAEKSSGNLEQLQEATAGLPETRVCCC